MSNNLFSQAVQDRCGTGPARLRNTALAGFALLTLVQVCAAEAGDPVAAVRDPVHLDFNVALLPDPLPPYLRPLSPQLQAPDQPGAAHSAGEFRPRGRSLLEKSPPPAQAGEAPPMHDTTVWERLSQYRAADRVRVVTLWEDGGSSVSLQAGMKGGPSLQWTSRLMNRGAATHGVLDPWLSSTLLGAARGLRGSPRAGNEPASRIPKALDAPGAPGPLSAVLK